LEQLYQKYRPGEKPPANLGASRDYNVDLVPKFIMASGQLVDMLLHTDVTRYLEFKSVSGSYVLRDGKVHKVPATEMEAAKSGLMSLFQKRYCKKFFTFIDGFDEKKKETWQGHDMNAPMKDVYTKFGLDAGTTDFIGHSMALYTDDNYINQPALPAIKRVKLYMDSLLRYGNSPYIYSVYGLGELPQGFARLAAIYGGTYMLNKPCDQVIVEGGVVTGVKSEGEVAKCDFVIGDPSYFPERVEKVGDVVRAICILDHPIPDTDKSDSCQIILPQKQIGRKSDMYIFCVSGAHQVCPPGKYIAIVMTNAETSNPEKELEPGLKLLGGVLEKFVIVSPLFRPKDDGKASKMFISRSYDAQSHFETACDDIVDIYRRVTGKDLVLKPKEPRGDD
jgi:Rab GDP dissociation inhibitor